MSSLRQALALAELNDATHSLQAKTEFDLNPGQHMVQFNLRLEEKVNIDNQEHLGLIIYKKDGSKMDIPIPLSNLQADQYTLIPVVIDVDRPDEHLRIQLTGTRSVVLLDRIVLSPK